MIKPCDYRFKSAILSVLRGSCCPWIIRMAVIHNGEICQSSAEFHRQPSKSDLDKVIGDLKDDVRSFIKGQKGEPT